MKSFPIAMAAALACAATAFAGEQRQLGAHQHGHGTLNIAIDGQTVSLELDAPGADIAGFEHEAKSAADKATVKNAIETLKQPLTLFKFPDAAGCSVKDATAGLETDDDEGKKGEEAHKAHEEHHADFNATALLDCKSPASLKSLTVSYFAAFKNAQSLTVSVVTPKGQASFEATRDKSVIDLSSLL